MASRRVSMLTNNKYVQPLKLLFNSKKLIAPNSAYTSILTKPDFVRPSKKDLKLKSWLRFNSETFDGIQVFAALIENGKLRSLAECSFSIYLIDAENNWSQTFLASVDGVSVDGVNFSATFSESDLSPAFLTGELTFKMEAKAKRFSKNYSDVSFFNHIGIYDSLVRLKNELEFLDISKVDE
jgi:hypothetical protein